MPDVPRETGKYSDWIVAALLATLPFCFATPYPSKNLLVGAAFLWGIATLITRADTRRAYRAVGLIVGVFLLHLVINLVNIQTHHLSWKQADLPSQILLYLIVGALFARPWKQHLFWAMVSATLLLLGGASLWQHYLQGIERPYGLNGKDWGSIEYAMVMLAMALFAVIQLMRRSLPGYQRLFHGVAAVVGFYGAVLTQSRGPLLAFAVALVLVLSLHFRRHRTWSLTAGTVAIALLIIGGASLSLNDKIRERFLEVHTEVVTYSPNSATGAVRERLEMWRTALRAFREHPWSGLGVNQFGDYSQAQVAQGKANESIAKYQHPHSEYLEALSTLGIAGGITIVLIFALPLGFFLRRCGDACERVGTQASAGAGLVVIYALSAFTDNVFYRPMPQSLYMFFVLGLMLSIAYQQLRPTDATRHAES